VQDNRILREGVASVYDFHGSAHRFLCLFSFFACQLPIYGYTHFMRSTKYIIWEDNGDWIGYLQDYPDIVTRGESFEDLQIKLSHLKHDLATGTHDRYHNPPATMTQHTPHRTKTHDRLERILSGLLEKP